MIRRAQAEALLKLAEALEECERNEVKTHVGDGHVGFDTGDGLGYLTVLRLTGMDVRFEIHNFYPKSEAAE